jgi:N-acetylated-alpha-linked acidic dipeptidase
MKIPVLPISWADAAPVLRALDGPVVPAEWRGALPFTYHAGPGPAVAHLKLSFEWQLVPVYDIIARMEGSELPDQWIIRGNHHDAWTHGAKDPVSGTIPVLEEARVTAELAKTGWHPRRTLVFCAWGGEEQGLLGSTEWVETHARDLDEKAVVYINSDTNARGFFEVGGSHALESFINQVARDVPDLQTPVSILERERARRVVAGQKAAGSGNLPIRALGSGSDYSPFFQHSGISALSMGFDGETSWGEYHTAYDTWENYTRFHDPGFAYGEALVRTAGRTVLRLSEANLLPFDFRATSRVISQYTKEVITLADHSRSTTEKENGLIASGMHQLAADPTKPFVAPKPKDGVPHLNFAPLENARDRLEHAAKAYGTVLDAWQSAEKSLDIALSKELNRTLYRAERALMREQGLPRRPWYRHVIYAPGFYTGYGVKTLPGVREAIEQRNWKEAEAFIQVTADRIDAFSKEIDRATDMLTTP